MSYKTIFLFDAGDLYLQLNRAVTALIERMPHQTNRQPSHEIILTWIRRKLDRTCYLLVDRVHDPELLQLLETDMLFLAQTQQSEDLLYGMISRAIYPHALPCFEAPCLVKLDRRTLMLTFDVGPVRLDILRT